MTAVDLTGLPQPDNGEATAILVAELLASIAAGDDADVVSLTAIIRDTAGYGYTSELIRRVNAACAQRWAEAT